MSKPEKLKKLSKEDERYIINIITDFLSFFKLQIIDGDIDFKKYVLNLYEKDVLEFFNTNESFSRNWDYNNFLRLIKSLSLDKNYHCSHEYDCCGCLCGIYINSTFSKRLDLITIVVTESYNR